MALRKRIPELRDLGVHRNCCLGSHRSNHCSHRCQRSKNVGVLRNQGFRPLGYQNHRPFRFYIIWVLNSCACLGFSVLEALGLRVLKFRVQGFQDINVLQYRGSRVLKHQNTSSLRRCRVLASQRLRVCGSQGLTVSGIGDLDHPRPKLFIRYYMYPNSLIP